MKALTLTQPWATLVALGQKTVETRSWSTDYRGPLAIHAAKGLGPVGGQRGLVEAVQCAPFYRALGAGRVADIVAALPLGAIVAVVELADVRPAWQVRVELLRRYNATTTELAELAFGDYSDGRFAWIFGSVRLVDPAIPCSGARRAWTVPPEVARTLS